MGAHDVAVRFIVVAVVVVSGGGVAVIAAAVVVDLSFQQGVFAENLVGLGFLWSVLLYETNPNPRKNICCGKKWPNY